MGKPCSGVTCGGGRSRSRSLTRRLTGGATNLRTGPPGGAVRRTAATGFLLYSLIVWWHETARRHPAQPLRLWHGKRGASFADMLAALRLETLRNTRQTYFSTPAIPPGIRKFIGQLTRLVSLAS